MVLYEYCDVGPLFPLLSSGSLYFVTDDADGWSARDAQSAEVGERRYLYCTRYRSMYRYIPGTGSDYGVAGYQVWESRDRSILQKEVTSLSL